MRWLERVKGNAIVDVREISGVSFDVFFDVFLCVFWKSFPHVTIARRVRSKRC